jgi:hypothetical protein
LLDVRLRRDDVAVRILREDGTIPQYEKPSWTQLNTFRTNAQINGTGVCQPPILRTVP